jgi:hypothetical protein
MSFNVYNDSRLALGGETTPAHMKNLLQNAPKLNHMLWHIREPGSRSLDESKRIPGGGDVNGFEKNANKDPFETNAYWTF